MQKAILARTASRRLIYLVTFFYALHYALTLYVESSYLAQYFPERLIGGFFSVAALFSLLTGIYLPRYLAENGNYRSVLTFVFLEIVALFALAFAVSPYIALPLFLIHQMLLAAVFIAINVLLENFSENASTGRTRGVFLTILNSAILLGPLTAGFFYHEDGFAAVFLAAALLMVPVFFFIATKLKHYRDPVYTKVRFLATLADVLLRKNIYRISVLRFLLEFFYSIMVIYTPLYLHTHLGIPFSDILGVILPVALLPFVILPYLLGKLADLKLGEKELITAGFVIISSFTALLSFTMATSVATWAFLLFVTRIGASLIETMTESYFFKHVHAADTNLIAFFANLRPLAFIIGPLAAVLFLAFFDLKYIFLSLGLVLAAGLYHALLLRDSR